MNEHSTPDWIVNVANVSPFGFVFNRSPVKRYKMSGFDRKLIWLYILGLVRIGLVNRIGSNFLFSFFRNPVVCCLWHGCSRSSNVGRLSPASIDLAISRVFLCVSFPLASNTFFCEGWLTYICRLIDRGFFLPSLLRIDSFLPVEIIARRMIRRLSRLLFRFCRNWCLWLLPVQPTFLCFKSPTALFAS